ncbi:MAG TPA: preprotein translocase subunit SecG [Candidatus Magasanikbacteria bacterium]|nr:preprotein translocase subunit SecG [Candidatus Magasanikbacteria bacterium]
MLYLNIAQIVLAVLLVTAILLQAKGTGLSGVFGGEGNIFRTKRGFEKILFYSTIVLAILFFAVAVANVYFSK